MRQICPFEIIKTLKGWLKEMKSKFLQRSTAAAAALTIGASLAAAMPASAGYIVHSDAKSLIQKMGAGWNLGNTLDALGGSGVNSEKAWGNPITTKAMVEAVHDAGFNTIRLPVSWAQHMDSDYVIDSAWMNRVKEVVNYAYEDGMYVILNIHHDNLSSGQKGMGFYPDSANKTASLKFINSVWSQVAEEFSDYDERLIFETLNEPRLAGTGYEWSSPQWDNSATMTDACNTINEFNQQAVNTIRSKGGYNKSRFIMAPGYAASVGSAMADIYKLPDDPAPGNAGRIIVSTHAYTPYDLCLGSDTDVTSAKSIQFTSAGEKELDNMFENLSSKFTSKGIQVVMGDMGISNKRNNYSRTKWASYYYSLSKQYGIPCVLWDNHAQYGSSKNENHWHFNRKTCKWGDPDVIKAIMDAMGVTNPSIPVDNSWANLGEQTLTVEKIPTKYFGDTAFTINAKASDGGTLMYESSDTSVISMNGSKATVRNAGTATITVIANETGKCKGCVTSFDVTVEPLPITPTISAISDQKYTGAAIKPSITVKNGTKTIASTNYTVEYSNNVNPGTATVKVTMKGNYSGTATANFKIVSNSGEEEKPTIATPTKSKINSYVSNTGTIKVKWTKSVNATGYNVYRYDPTAKSWKKIGETPASKLYYLDKKLNPGTVYKYKVRPFNKSNGSIAWGSSSLAVSLMTRPLKTTVTNSTAYNTKIKLTWKSINCMGYQVQMLDTSTNKWTTKKTVNTNTANSTVTGLKSGKKYSFRVRAFTKNAAGKKVYGGWSKTYSASTKK